MANYVFLLLIIGLFVFVEGVGAADVDMSIEFHTPSKLTPNYWIVHEVPKILAAYAQHL